jgi:hypothetical protein
MVIEHREASCGHIASKFILLIAKQISDIPFVIVLQSNQYGTALDLMEGSCLTQVQNMLFCSSFMGHFAEAETSVIFLAFLPVFLNEIFLAKA